MSYIRCYILKSACARGRKSDTTRSRRKPILGAPLLLAPKLQVGCQTNAWPITPGDFAQFLAVIERVPKLGFRGFQTSFRNVPGRLVGAGAARAGIG